MTDTVENSRGGFVLLRALRTLAAILAVSIASGCSTGPSEPGDLVVIGPPRDRFDHNRTLAINKWLASDEHGAPQTISLPRLDLNGVESPAGSDNPNPRPPRDSQPADDGLPNAQLRVRFNGIYLPLTKPVEPSPASRGQARTDWDDLLHFLASGPAAHEGLEKRLGAGQSKQATEAEFAPILAILEDGQALRSREALKSAADHRRLRITDNVVDSRYADGELAKPLAIYHHKFWFVFFARRPETALDPPFSRLVVVPDRQATRGPESGEPVRTER
jgi:hypothetical protein